MSAIPITQRTAYGLRLGFPEYIVKPDRIELAYNEMVERWAAYMDACAISEIARGAYTYQELEDMVAAARLADAEYQRLMDAWAKSQGECTCRPDGDACPVCVARNAVYGDEMPY